mgnify:CR=1 FL=1
MKKYFPNLHRITEFKNLTVEEIIVLLVVGFPFLIGCYMIVRAFFFGD